MFQPIWASSRGPGRTHCPGLGSRRVRAANPPRAEAGSEGGGGAGPGGFAAPAAARCRGLRTGAGSGAPGGGRRGRPARPSLDSSLPASHFGGWEAARPQTAGRESACSGSLAGRDGSAAPCRRAPRGGLPHPRARAPRRLQAAQGPRPGPPRPRAAPLCGPALLRAHGFRGGRRSAGCRARARVSGVRLGAALGAEAAHCSLGGGGGGWGGPERPPRLLGAPAPPRGRSPDARARALPGRCRAEHQCLGFGGTCGQGHAPLLGQCSPESRELFQLLKSAQKVSAGRRDPFPRSRPYGSLSLQPKCFCIDCFVPTVLSSAVRNSLRSA